MRTLISLHDSFFGRLAALFDGWGIGLAARLAFGSVLLVFFLNSAATKVGSGFPGFLIPDIGAYAQMFPPVAEEAGYDIDAIAFFPWKLVALAGTWGEALLPLLVLLGLFTRLASAGMLVFIAVMTFVDIGFHGVDATAIGAPFDRVQDSPIWDQRLLWAFPLFVLMLKGAGRVSLDAVLAARWNARR
jgi:putative oxidoreductase